MFTLHKRDQRTDVLARIELFAGLRREQLSEISRLTTAIDVLAGRTLCEAGRRGDEFFVIRDGEATVSTGHSLGPGAFGEMALVRDEPRSATVVTATACSLLVLTRREFAALRRVDGRIAASIEHAIETRRRPSSTGA